MSKKGLLIIVALLTVAAIFVNGVARAEGRFAIVFATGGLGDKSFNDSAFAGMEKAVAELGIEYDRAEPTAIAEYESFLTRFAVTRRYDLIISIGFDQADALSKVAQHFPEQRFAIVDMVVEQPNVASYVFAEQERGFLIGVASALMTSRSADPKVNPARKIGVIGGMKIPLIDANIAGFYAGAKFVDPQVEVIHSYVGAWDDPTKGKELALSMVEQGVDIIWGAAGRSGLGVIKAAAEKDCYAIGADSDQGHLAPDNVLTNGMKYVNNTVFLAIEQVLNQQFATGIHVLGVKEGALGYSRSLLPAEVIGQLEAIKTRLINGEIEIPASLAE